MINPIPLGGGSTILDIRITPGVYISNRLSWEWKAIELGYGIDITTFNVLFRLKIDSRYP
jgi:hypothetical protein